MQQPRAMSIIKVTTASYICNDRIKFLEVLQPLLWGKCGIEASPCYSSPGKANGCLYLKVKKFKHKLCQNVILHFQTARRAYVYLNTVVPDINY